MSYYIFKNGKKISIHTSSKLGRGAAATVYSIANHSGKVAKIYHDSSTFDQAKIEAMIDNPPRQGKQIQYAWPEALIFDQHDQPIGYMMKEIKDTVDLETAITPLLRARFGMKQLESMPMRVALARNLAAALVNLHANDHYFIDLKPQNIRLYERDLTVVFIDCDGFRIQEKNENIYPATMYSAEYIAPEALDKKPTELGEKQDRFALAVLIFKILNNGIHPFQGIVDQQNINTIDDKVREGLYAYGVKKSNKIKPIKNSIHHCWPDKTRKLFDQAFITQTRPSSKDWYDHLNALLDKKQGYFQKCANEPEDPNHIHFKGKPCIQGCKKPSRKKHKKRKNKKAKIYLSAPCPYCSEMIAKKPGWFKYGIITVWKLDFNECKTCGKPYDKNGKNGILFWIKLSFWRLISYIITLIGIGLIGLLSYLFISY